MLNSNSQNHDRQPSYLPMVVCVLLALLAVRLVSLWFNNSELFFDEAQYWVWAQNPDFGYFSKPPVLAWLIGATTYICGSDSAFCVRLGAPILQIASAIMVYLSARHLFDERTGFWAAITYALLPGISLSSTIISTDVPLMFCWSIALYAFLKLEASSSAGWVLLLGVAIGAGLMSKYAMLYFFLCAALYCLLSPKRPHILFSPKLWLAFLIAIACLGPNIWWNSQNGFATVAHTGDNIDWQGLNLHFDKALEFIGSQFGVFGPILFSIYLIAMIGLVRKGASQQHLFLAAFSIPILLIIVFQALMSKAFANWAALTYVAASIFLADLLVNHLRPAWNKISTTLHIVIFLGISVAVTRAGPGELVLPNGEQPFARTQGAAKMSEFVRQELAKGDYKAVVTVGRRLSSLVPYNLRDTSVHKLSLRTGTVPQDHFELKHAYQDNPIEPALVVVRKERDRRYLDAFTSVELVGTHKIGIGEVKNIWLYRVSGFQSKVVNQ